MKAGTDSWLSACQVVRSALEDHGCFLALMTRIMECQTDYRLPVVDFTNENMKAGTDSWLSACQVVRSALEDHGCFLALYDKVGPQLHLSLSSLMEELFDLPLETKRQETSDKPFHGYFGQVSKIPLYESLAIDDPLTSKGCEKFTNIMWPQGNHHFCESVEAYAKLVIELDQMVKRMVFESYGVDRQRCDSFIESTNYLLRCLKIRTPEKDESNLGLHPHTDMTILSILHQLNVSGLEIKLKDGVWVQVDACPSLFVVMAGDALGVWSNDRIRPCEHRVTMNAKKTRYSTVLFSHASKMVEIPEELVDEQHPLLYKPFDHYGYFHYYHTNKFSKAASRAKDYCGI